MSYNTQRRVKVISNRTRFQVLRRFGFKCVYCGRGYTDSVLEVDHIKPLADGGTDDIGNLVAACYDCNRGKGALPDILPPLPTPSECIAVNRKTKRAETNPLTYTWGDGGCVVNSEQVGNSLAEGHANGVLRGLLAWMLGFNYNDAISIIEDEKRKFYQGTGQ